MKNKIESLKNILNQSSNIVFFTGAGVSVGSGVPDFRSMGGLFDEISKEGYSPEYLLSRDYLQDDPEGFINFCHKRLMYIDKAPNTVHQWIAQLEDEEKSLGVITQNIDGFHSDAGSKHVDELHGSLNTFYCNQCHQQYSKKDVIERQLKQCDICGATIRPDIVLYGEMLDQNVIMRAIQKIENADTLVVLGSSLVVQPAAGLISNFKGDNLIIINKDNTPYDSYASLVINDDMIDVVSELNK